MEYVLKMDSVFTVVLFHIISLQFTQVVTVTAGKVDNILNSLEMEFILKELLEFNGMQAEILQQKQEIDSFKKDTLVMNEFRNELQEMRKIKYQIAEMNEILRKQNTMMMKLQSRVHDQHIRLKQKDGEIEVLSRKIDNIGENMEKYCGPKYIMDNYEHILVSKNKTMTKDELGKKETHYVRSEQESQSETAKKGHSTTKRLLTGVQQNPSGVAFSSYLDHRIPHLSVDHTIPFNKVILNDGNGYNEHTGLFRCPQTGVYLFSFFISNLHMQHQLIVKLVLDGINVVDAVSEQFHNGQDQMGGNMAILQCKAGQSVYVQSYHETDAGLDSDSGFRYSTFSGVLLY